MNKKYEPVGSTKEFFRPQDVAEMMRKSIEVLEISGLKSKGIKHDEGKPEFDRLSYGALGAINAVHKYGDNKYEKGNWKKGLHFTRLLNAAIRHISSTLNGELFDKESGLLHVAHAATSLEMVLHYLLNHEKYKDFDDLDYNTHLTTDK